MRRLLSGEPVVKATERTFTVWKTITLGLQKSAEDYKKSLESNGFQISGYACQILKKILVSQTEIMLDLVILTVAELGFKRGTTFQQICSRAKELGLELCPAEVGPALRLAYSDQPCGEWLRITMEPIPDSGGRSDVFSVDRDGGERWLDTDWFGSGGVWAPGTRVVFVLPRK